MSTGALEVYNFTYFLLFFFAALCFLTKFPPFILVLSIHMDDQIDSKTLIGSYVCTEQPGEFRWQPGSLTQVCIDGSENIHHFHNLALIILFNCYAIVFESATSQAVLKGFWVVFEDIDKAPMDVLSILLPLLEGASSFATGHGEVLTFAYSLYQTSFLQFYSLYLNYRHQLHFNFVLVVRAMIMCSHVLLEI